MWDVSRRKHRKNIIGKSFAILILLLLLSIPLMLNGIFSGELSGAWIGFWGSFAGGILGTLGVIFVAHIQSNQQRRLTEESMTVQRSLNNEQIQTQIESMNKTEKFNRERLRIETQIKMLESYIEDVNKLTTETFELKAMILELSSFRRIFDAYNASEISETDEDLKRKKEHFFNQYELTKEKFKRYHYGYFLTALNDISYRNEVLAHDDVVLNTDKIEFAASKIDEMNRMINSELHPLDVKKLEIEFSNNNRINLRFIYVDVVWDWLRAEQANIYQSMKDLIEKLEDIDVG